MSYLHENFDERVAVDDVLESSLDVADQSSFSVISRHRLEPVHIILHTRAVSK